MVEGLSLSFSNEQLRVVFIPFGIVVSAKILTDPQGNSLHIGMVEMSTLEEAARAKVSSLAPIQGKALCLK